MNEVKPATIREAEEGKRIPSRPLQSSLRQPKNGSEPKKGVSFSPDVPLETPSRPPLSEIIRRKESSYFFKRCCVLVVVVVIIVVGVLILASTVHEDKKENDSAIV